MLFLQNDIHSNVELSLKEGKSKLVLFISEELSQKENIFKYIFAIIWDYFKGMPLSMTSKVMANNKKEN